MVISADLCLVMKKIFLHTTYSCGENILCSVLLSKDRNVGKKKRKKNACETQKDAHTPSAVLNPDSTSHFSWPNSTII